MEGARHSGAAFEAWDTTLPCPFREFDDTLDVPSTSIRSLSFAAVAIQHATDAAAWSWQRGQPLQPRRCPAERAACACGAGSGRR
jgi:hypothetical protein